LFVALLDSYIINDCKQQVFGLKKEEMGGREEEGSEEAAGAQPCGRRA
jgi:hypothetical protein